MHAMITGTGLDAKFWPYAFHAYMRIKNALPGRDNTPSSFERSHGTKPNFCNLCTFGCRVWV
jgi:hypothetical protein